MTGMKMDVEEEKKRKNSPSIITRVDLKDIRVPQLVNIPAALNSNEYSLGLFFDVLKTLCNDVLHYN